ncbi:MAG: biopolymer transporter ExbD [Rubripirellula sp.]|nr:biopolymer transporter ExbD [Rubripirellula sp.]
MKASRKKKRRKVQVPIASMGDIAFLLIIFFMLLSEFSKEKDLAIDLPRSDQVNKTEVVVVARVAMTADGAIYFDGDRVDNAKDIEWGVRALLSKTVADEQRHVQFKCDAALSKEKFEPVLKAIAEGGGIIEAVGENQ